jgi:hypothetical protein
VIQNGDKRNENRALVFTKKTSTLVTEGSVLLYMYKWITIIKKREKKLDLYFQIDFNATVVIMPIMLSDFIVTW